ncbi:hypothetical protein RvY_03312 [Ramazzottius varieornatus]|uniref:Uncharacterized protein n=1 Tax=Ramazzottius varieornatus TaxID=947166 RepID=A0A1D1UXU2_RAMVA|nr:hypothetical protein RvY_03312 [Ramazzottius varieornatus]
MDASLWKEGGKRAAFKEALYYFNSLLFKLSLLYNGNKRMNTKSLDITSTHILLAPFLKMQLVFTESRFNLDENFLIPISLQKCFEPLDSLLCLLRMFRISTCTYISCLSQTDL